MESDPPGRGSPADPPLIALSLAIYRVLLAAYPAPFRAEYGPWMAQAFRDQCLRAFRVSGPGGMLPLWSAILLDWLKTIVEQRTMKGFSMTRAMLIRVCGWCLVFSAASVLLGMLSSVLYSGTTDPHNGLYRPFDPWLYLGQRLFFPAFTLLQAVGMAGLYLRYGPAVGWVGRLALAAGAVGGVIAFVFFAVMVLAGEGNEPDGAWDRAMLGLLLMFSGLALFGGAALRYRALGRWSWAPLATGGLVLVLAVLSMGLVPIMPELLAVVIFGVLTCGLALLGWVLLQEVEVERVAV